MMKAGRETIQAVLMKPSETFERMKRRAGSRAPLLFVVIYGTVCGIIGSYSTSPRFNLGVASLIPTVKGMEGVAADSNTTGSCARGWRS